MRIQVLALASLIAMAGCKEEVVPITYESVPVTQRNIVVAVRATGSILPDTLVEVKSKASGEILQMLVETGQVVNRGVLLVRVDQRVPKNRLAEAEAQLDVIRTRLATAESQWRRSQELFTNKAITEQEYENAQLAVANAKAAVISAEVQVQTAQIAMSDTDVLAPISGTILTKSVERGQVISSPSSDVGGGTVLLTMADLDLVQVRTLVDEVDIGKIKEGLRSTVTVNAYPNQPFQGEVLKVEPKAETAQNVTMFPVIIRVANRQGLLKPGMNADVQIHVGQRDNVLAVPNAALRTERDVGSAAMVLGLSDEQLQPMLVTAKAVRDSLAARARPAGDSTARAARPAAPQPAAGKAAGATMEFMGQSITLPEGVTEAQVTAALGRLRSQQSTDADRALMAKLRPAGGGSGGGFGGGGAAGGGGRPRASTVDFQFGGSYIVFVNRGAGPEPVYVQTGLTDLDYSEVVRGLVANDQVLLLPSASLLQSQEEWRDRMQRMTGNSGVPGIGTTSTGTGTTARPTGTTGGGPTPPTGGGRP
ncbi:MAG: efflux RND transporter periplasmic adaptor subunit [Gemmatimonadota bacterium]|nr:efflux RND transporter periplasmic adaptor subunit [Gemmatimonadota bacterium]